MRVIHPALGHRSFAIGGVLVGGMLNAGQNMMYQSWLLAVWPGLAIVFSVWG